VINQRLAGCQKNAVRRSTACADPIDETGLNRIASFSSKTVPPEKPRYEFFSLIAGRCSLDGTLILTPLFVVNAVL
jgi:hypothetical protein